MQQPDWHEHLSLQELAFLRTSSLPGASATLQRLQWRLDPQGRALERTDDAGRCRTYRFGEDSPAVLKQWLTEAHVAHATHNCGRIRRKLHRQDPSLAVGLDLPRPEGCVRFAFQGHRQVYAKATTRAERFAALACGGTGWHYNARYSLQTPAQCFCSKLWPSRAHLLWNCPHFADDRADLPLPVNRVEERLLGRPIPEFPPAPEAGGQVMQPQFLQLLEQAAKDNQDDLLLATDGSSENGIGAFAVACERPRLDLAGADSGEDQTPFRMELLGILSVLEALKLTAYPPRHVTILVDCESAMKAVCCPGSSKYCALAAKAKQAGDAARQRGTTWQLVWVPSHGKPSWTPKSPLQAAACRSLNQAADDAANRLRRDRSVQAARVTWHQQLRQVEKQEMAAVLLSARTSSNLEAFLCTASR